MSILSLSTLFIRIYHNLLVYPYVGSLGKRQMFVFLIGFLDSDSKMIRNLFISVLHDPSNSHEIFIQSDIWSIGKLLFIKQFSMILHDACVDMPQVNRIWLSVLCGLDLCKLCFVTKPTTKRMGIYCFIVILIIVVNVEIQFYNQYYTVMISPSDFANDQSVHWPIWFYSV